MTNHQRTGPTGADEGWSEWIEWNGGECPLPDGTIHEVEYRDGEKCKDDLPETSYWGIDGDDCDIIAYRYRLDDNAMTPESDIHPDLEFLARNVSEWASQENLSMARKSPVGAEFYDPEYLPCDDGFTKPQWLQARKDLGLIMSEEEGEMDVPEHTPMGGNRTAENFLHEAANLMTERGKQYDHPCGERSMGKAVSALNAITGRDLTEAEGWLLMSLVKRVRQHSGAGYHKDSAEDAVAYAALEAEALESSAPRVGKLEQ